MSTLLDTGKLAGPDIAEPEDELEDDGLPPIVSLADYKHILPPLAEPVIEGVLRKGHKMLLVGPSKAGKSFCLIELCVCIAEGKPWLGFPCTQGKVLYINLELDEASCSNRLVDIYKALEWNPDHIGNIDVWNLRGHALPMDKLAPIIIRRYRNKGYAAIVIDPIYKVLTGNENKAYDMAQFSNYFEQVAEELGCAVIYCHHHGKGDQSWKNPMDRASGSGVFARDPDALLDVTELELPPDRQQEGISAWRVTGTLREFRAFPPVDIWFNPPIHTVEHFDSKEIAPHHELPAWRRAMNARKSQAKKLRERNHRLTAAYDICSADGQTVTTGSLAEYLGVSTQTIRNMIDEHPDYYRADGQVKRR